MKYTEHTPLMHAVLDGEATPGESAELTRLLAADPAARAEFDELQRLFEGLKAIPRPFPPEGLVYSVMAGLPAYSPQRPTRFGGVRQLFSRSRVIGTTGEHSTEAPGTFPGTSATVHPISRRGPHFRGEKNMSEQNTSSVGNRKIWIGAGVAAAAVIVAVSTGVLPPSGKDTAGTIVPATRYQAPQPTAADVKLGNPSSAQSSTAVPAAQDAAAQAGTGAAIGAATQAGTGAAMGAKIGADAAAKISADAAAKTSADVAAQSAATTAQSAATNSSAAAAQSAQSAASVTKVNANAAAAQQPNQRRPIRMRRRPSQPSPRRASPRSMLMRRRPSKPNQRRPIPMRRRPSQPSPRRASPRSMLMQRRPSKPNQRRPSKPNQRRPVPQRVSLDNSHVTQALTDRRPHPPAVFFLSQPPYASGNCDLVGETVCVPASGACSSRYCPLRP